MSQTQSQIIQTLKDNLQKANERLEQKEDEYKVLNSENEQLRH